MTARTDIQAQSRTWPSWDLRPRQLCDLELLLNGGFSPLARLHGPRATTSPCALGCGWPTARSGRSRWLWTSRRRWRAVSTRGARLALRDPEGLMLAVLTVDEVWRPDRRAEARAVYGTRRSGTPRRRAPARANRALSTSRESFRASNSPITTTSRTCRAHPGPAAGGVRASRLAKGDRLPDAQPDAPCALRAHPPGRTRGGGESPHPPGRRPHEARRPRPLRAGALLRGPPAPIPASHGAARAAAARHADGGAARGRSGTRSSARTTAARTSSSAATTRARDRDPDGPPFYDPYDAQELVRAHEAELGDHDGPLPEHGVRRGDGRATCPTTRCRRAAGCSASPAPSCAGG